MVFIPSKNPGPSFSLAKQQGAAVSRAVADGRMTVSASIPGGQIPLPAVRGTTPVRSQLTTQPRVRAKRVGPLGSMEVPRFQSVPVCGRSAPDGPPDMWPSQMNLHYLKASAMPYGRQLRGFGLLPDASPAWGDTWAGNDPAVNEAAQADDSVGNGIFDGPGAPPTAHAGSGVFESTFGMPGYLYREQPTQPSEIRDTTTGMPVVYQPDAGGSWYDDTRDAYRPFDLETPRLYDQRPLSRQKMVPAVRLPHMMPPVRIPALTGFGEVEVPSADKFKAWAMWGLLGAFSALGVTLVLRSMRSSY